MDNLIICGFSGIGKSTAVHLYKDKVLDFESSYYSKLPDGSQNPAFPQNYVEAISKEFETGNNKVILTSCHADVRKLLKENNLPYLIVLPNADARNEYVIRWLSRGSKLSFIKNMYNHWYEYIDSCFEDDAPKVCLETKEYLVSILNRMHWEAWK